MRTTRPRTLLLCAGIPLAACDLLDDAVPGTCDGVVDPVTVDADVTASCREGGEGTVLDGWHRVIGDDFVTVTGQGLRVELHYPFPLDDALRQGTVAENIWDHLLTGRFTPGARVVGNEGAGLTTFIEGDAVDAATGEAVRVIVLPEVENGVALPIVVVAPDVATMQAAFPTVEDIALMHGQNRFPFHCGRVAGTWTSSFAEALETYDSVGDFTGVSVAALTEVLRLDDNGDYEDHTEAFVDGVAEERDEQGCYVANDFNFTMTDATAGSFVGGFIAVREGLALTLQNVEFPGDVRVLYRTQE